MAEECKLTRVEKDELVAARESFSLPDLDALDEVVEAMTMGMDDQLLFHVGVWFGDEVARITGWVWVWVAFGEGIEAPALVSADRGLCLLPLQFVATAVETKIDPMNPVPNTLRTLIERLRSGARPNGEVGSYALVGARQAQVGVRHVPSRLETPHPVLDHVEPLRHQPIEPLPPSHPVSL